MSNYKHTTPMEIFSNFLKVGNNPQEIEKVLFMKYPSLRVLKNQMVQSGLTATQFALQVAKQNNIPIQQNDITYAISQLNNMVSKT